MERFEDGGMSLVDFVGEVLVRCPSCGNAARVACAAPVWGSELKSGADREAILKAIESLLETGP